MHFSCKWIFDDRSLTMDPQSSISISNLDPWESIPDIRCLMRARIVMIWLKEGFLIRYSACVRLCVKSCVFLCSMHASSANLFTIRWWLHWGILWISRCSRLALRWIFAVFRVSYCFCLGSFRSIRGRQHRRASYPYQARRLCFPSGLIWA